MKAIVNANLILEDGVLEGGVILIDGERIYDVGAASAVTLPEGTDIIDARGAYVGPGFVDIHVHGISEFDTALNAVEASEALLRCGTTSHLATPSYSMNLELSLEAIRSARAAMGKAPTLRGIYMEGPYINPDYGAYSHLNPWRGEIKEEDYRRLVDAAGGDVRVWTTAPERAGLLPFLKYAREVNPEVIFALGHSEASPDEIRALGEYRPTLMTHTFDATGRKNVEAGTRGVGPDEYALTEPEVACELISDSLAMHVKPELQKLLLIAKGRERVILITDRTALGGLSTGDGSCDLNFDDKDGLAGSLMCMNMAVRNVMRHTGIRIHEAFALASRNPARLIGLGDEIGTLTKGKYADLVFVDGDINILGVVLRGELQNFAN